jgi:hypothetical protein
MFNFLKQSKCDIFKGYKTQKRKTPKNVLNRHLHGKTQNYFFVSLEVLIIVANFQTCCECV